MRQWVFKQGAWLLARVVDFAAQHIQVERKSEFFLVYLRCWLGASKTQVPPVLSSFAPLQNVRGSSAYDRFCTGPRAERHILLC